MDFRPARRALLVAYALVSLLYTAPFWVVDYVPTTDGPTHVYNAHILRRLILDPGGEPLFDRHYEINSRPVPNWTTHVLLATLMGAVSPGTAEKIVTSAIVLVFLAGAWVLVGSAGVERERGLRSATWGSWPAFLAFPFAYHQLFQWGFYNFALGVGLYLLAVGLWWRRCREGGRGRFAVAINAILLVAWLAHPLPFLLAVATIGVLWLLTLRAATWRRHALHLAVLAPQALLPAWWFLGPGAGEVMPSGWTPAREMRYLLRLEVLHTFQPLQTQAGAVLCAVFVLLLAVAGWRAARSRTLRAGGDPFLLVAALLVTAYFLAPEGYSGGILLKQRLSLFPFLLLLPFFAARLGDAGGRIRRGVVTGALIAVALANLAFLTHWYRVLDRQVAGFLDGLAQAPPGTRGLNLLFDRLGASSNTDIYGHAIDRVALEKGILDWGNFEVRSGQFPLQLRPGVEATPIQIQQAQPWLFPVGEHRDIVDFIYTWRMPADSPVAGPIELDYELASSSGGGSLWIRR